MQRTISQFIVLVCTLSFVATPKTISYGYNRAKAREYGIQYGVDQQDPQDDGINPKYQHFPGDCANFISQCVIAGGVRFCSIQWGICNDNTFNPGFGVPELEIRKDTTWINDSDQYFYVKITVLDNAGNPYDSNPDTPEIESTIKYKLKIDPYGNTTVLEETYE